MKKSQINRKEIVLAVLMLLGGIALTVASFCIYYLAKPQNEFILATICVIDFAYNFFTWSMFFKTEFAKKWLLKGFLLAVGYIVAFIIIAVIIILVAKMFNGASEVMESLKNNILVDVLYAFFTAPCALIISAVFVLGMSFM